MRKNIIVSIICVLILSVFVVFIVFSSKGNSLLKRSGNDAEGYAKNSQTANGRKTNNDIVVEFLDTPVNLSGYGSNLTQSRKINSEEEMNGADELDENRSGFEKTNEDEELDEIKGKDGVDGKDGKDGKDGINGKDGRDGVDGKNGLDGKDGKDGKNGLNGKDGKNPQKGVDYFTQDEKREIVEEVVKEVYGLADNGEIMFSAENAYEVWLHNHEGTEEDFFEFLKGEKGDKGDKGDEGVVKISEYTADYDETQNVVTFKCVTNSKELETVD